MPTNFAGRLRPGLGTDSRFACYVLASLYSGGWPRAAIRQTTGIQNLDLDQFLTFRVGRPSADDQRAIADYLDAETARIDALIEKKRRMIELLREREQREVERWILPNVAPHLRRLPTDVPLLAEFPSSWALMPLSALLSWITYGFTNPMPVADNGPLILTANDVLDGAIAYEHARKTSDEAFSQLLTDKSRPKDGDILLTKDGSLGRVALFGGWPRACINQSIALLRPNPHIILPDLLMELLRTPAYRDALIFNAGGSTIKHLYITRVVKQRVAFPPGHDDQHVLVNEIRRVRHRYSQVRAALTTEVELLMERRQALITAAVTGKLDIPGIAA